LVISDIVKVELTMVLKFTSVHKDTRTVC